MRKKRALLGATLALGALLCLAIGALSGSKNAIVADAEGNVSTTVTKVEEANGGLRLTLSENDYTAELGANLQTLSNEGYNYLDSILVYTDDTTYTTAREALGEKVYYNMWQVYGTVTIQLSNIEDVVKIVIPADTQFPSLKFTGFKDLQGATTEPTSMEKTAYVVEETSVYVKKGGEWKYENPNKETVDTSIMSLVGENNGFTLKLSENDYQDGPTYYNIVPKDRYKEYNFLDNILIYTSETEYVTLADAFANNTQILYNMWQRSGLLSFAHLEPTIFDNAVRIVIPGGTQLPSFAYTGGNYTSVPPVGFPYSVEPMTNTMVCYTIKHTVAFEKSGNAWMLDVADDIPVDAHEIAIENELHIRGYYNETEGGWHCFILFFLPTSDYPVGQTTLPIGALQEKYNTLDNILLWYENPEESGAEYITLREAYEQSSSKEMYYNIWEEYNTVGYILGQEHNGLSFNKITVKKGCEFPSYEFTTGQNVETRKAYVQTETVSFIDWYPSEDFSVNWRVAPERDVTEINSVEVVEQAGDNVVMSLSLTNSDYEQAELNVTAGGLDQVFAKGEFNNNIVIDGKPLGEYEGKGLRGSWFNYGKKGTFAVEIPGVTDPSSISTIVIKKGCYIPSYENTMAGIEAYGVCYYSVGESIAFQRNETTGEWEKLDTVFWTVDFDGYGSAMVMDGGRITAEDYPMNPTKVGYEFVGWYNGAREWRESDIVMSDITLTAKFLQVYTINFDTDGAGAIETQKVREDKLIEKPVDPKKEGYVFKGWYNGNTAFDFETRPTGNMTLTAKWEKEESGCGSSLAAGGITALVTLVGGALLIRKKK